MPTPLEVLLDPTSLTVFAAYAALILWEHFFPARELPRAPAWRMRGLAAFALFFALSTYLARRVRQLMFDQSHWAVLPEDVREWLELQRDRSMIVREDELLLETFPRGRRHFMTLYPFEGRLAHTTLAMLLTRRLERAGAGPLGFVCNDYALAIWALEPMDGLDFDALFAQDMLGDDLEAWLDESFMMKRAFKGCAIISGLIERRFPGAEQKTRRQITFSTDLIYDVLRRHQPDHLLLRCARADAATGMIDVARLGDMLARISAKLTAMARDGAIRPHIGGTFAFDDLPKALDALGHPQTCFNSVANLRKRGKHVQVGLLLAEQATPPIPMAQVIAHELEILGSHGMQAHRYGAMLDMISAGKLTPQQLVGRRIDLAESIPALMAMDRFEGTGVTIIDRF